MNKPSEIFEKFEKIFTVVALIVYSNGIILLLLSGGANEGDVAVNYNTSLYQAIFILIYLLTFVLLGLRWKKFISVFQSNKLVWLLLLLTIISVLWSFDSTKTIRDSFRLISSSAFGIYLATRYTLKEQLKILGVTFGIMVILSFIFSIGLPKYGIMGGVHAGKWRGIFMHKNGLGSMMTTSCMTFLLLGLKEKNQPWLYWSSFILSLILLILAVSAASLINLIILICVFIGLRSLWLSYRVMVPTIIGIFTLVQAFYFWFASNADLVFGAFGRDASLSGRDLLWSLVFEKIWKQPWLGYGYSGFWNGFDGESASIWYSASWVPTHPHNGFLGLWLDLGLLGLIIFILGFGINFFRSLALIQTDRSLENLLPTLLFTFLLLTNLVETSFLKNDSFTWILYISLSTSTIMALKSNKRKVFSALNGDNQQIISINTK